MRIGQGQLMIKTNRLYFRILGYFLFLIIPTLIVGFIVYFANISIFKRQLMEDVSSNLASSSKTVDIYLRTAEQTGMNFLANDTVQQYLSPAASLTIEERARSSSINKVLSSSRTIISPYIDDMFVYVDKEWIYKSDGLESFQSFFTRFYEFDAYDTDYWEQLLDETFAFRVLPTTMIKKSFTEQAVTVVPVVMGQYIRGNRVVVVITISVSSMMDVLKKNAAYASTTYLVMDQDGRPIVADHTVSANPSEWDPTMIRTVYESEYGWKYYAFTPVTEYRQQASGILLVTAWLSFILFIIGIVFAFVFSTKLYNPIRNLIEAQNKHEQFSSEFLENAFTFILNGSNLDKHEAFMEMIGFEKGEYLCCSIKFTFKDAFMHDIQDIDRLMIMEKLRKVLEGVLKNYVNAYVIDSQNQLYIAMINLREPDDYEKFERGLKSIMQTFDYDLKYYSLAIGVGHIYSHIGELSKSFGDARMALAKADPMNDFQIVHASNQPKKEGFHLSFVDENKVINGMKVGDSELLEREVRTIVELNLHKGTAYSYMNLLLIQLYNIGIKYSNEKGINPVELLSEEEHTILSGKSKHILDLNDHLESLLSFYRAILERTVDTEDNKTGQLVARIIAYIDEHYSQDLYLERIAEEMNLSAKYVSKLFKDIAGTNLTDYISMKRVAEAKRLLAATTMKNDQIAEQVGILSRATFFRLFKKYEGVTPQEYRTMLRKETVADD